MEIWIIHTSVGEQIRARSYAYDEYMSEMRCFGRIDIYSDNLSASRPIGIIFFWVPSLWVSHLYTHFQVSSAFRRWLMKILLERNRISLRDMLKKTKFSNCERNNRVLTNGPFCTVWNALSNGTFFYFSPFLFSHPCVRNTVWQTLIYIYIEWPSLLDFSVCI